MHLFYTWQYIPFVKFSQKDSGRCGEYLGKTLRPETVYGQTNLWVDPDVEYRRAQVDGEVWMLTLDPP